MFQHAAAAVLSQKVRISDISQQISLSAECSLAASGNSKDRLLHEQCLKCDYNQMCMQIVSEAKDLWYHTDACFYVLLSQIIINHYISAIWQETT